MSWEQKLLEGRRGLRGHVRGTRRCLESRQKIRDIKDTLRYYKENKTRVAQYKIRVLENDLKYYRARRDEYCKLAGIDI